MCSARVMAASGGRYGPCYATDGTPTLVPAVEGTVVKSFALLVFLAFALTFASAVKELIRPSRLGGEPRPVGGESSGAGVAVAEDFEREPLPNWEFIGSPPPAVGPTGGGRALICSGTSYGVLGGVSVSDMALQFRFRQGAGVGEVVLRGRPEWRDSSVWSQHYRVCFRPDRIALVKRSGAWPTPVEEELASAPAGVPVGAW